MFENSIYEQEPPAPEPQEGDIFSHYEIKPWDYSPRLYQILGISAFLNILVVVVVAQTSLLTMKGCDSPLVGNVCQVLDTVYLGTKLFGTNREYVDAAYDKTKLGDVDITYIDDTGVTPPLSYPDGYFELANPEEMAMIQAGADNPSVENGQFPGIPTMSQPYPTARPTSRNNLFNTPPVYPKANKGGATGKLPGFNDQDDANSGDKGNKGNDGKIPGIPNTIAGNGTNPTDPSASPSPAPSGDDILLNKRPFVDLANNLNDLLDKNEVKLDSPFTLNASGKLTKDGKLDPKSFRYLNATSKDAKLIDVVKDAVEAINESGYLQYLSALSGKDFKLMLQQDDTNITANVQSEMESEARANSIKSSLDILIAVKKQMKSGANADQNDKDDLALLENAKIMTMGKRVIIQFVVPKSVALPMIQRKLADQKNAPKQPNGSAQMTPDNRTAAK